MTKILEFDSDIAQPCKYDNLEVVKISDKILSKRKIAII